MSLSICGPEELKEHVTAPKGQQDRNRVILQIFWFKGRKRRKKQSLSSLFGNPAGRLLFQIENPPLGFEAVLLARGSTFRAAL